MGGGNLGPLPDAAQAPGGRENSYPLLRRYEQFGSEYKGIIPPKRIYVLEALEDASD